MANSSFQAMRLVLWSRHWAGFRMAQYNGTTQLLGLVGPAAALFRGFHLHGCKREHLNFQRSDLSRKSIAGAERAATERPWKDTLLASPGAISADLNTQLMFIADTNHHRIIIADGDGKIVDCIGSSPGREDGTFETAQLCYPASAVFEADRNYLYIADSENHVVRRADLSTRILSTVTPAKTKKSERTVWGKILAWIGSSRQRESEEQEPQKAGDCDGLRYPWHLKFANHGSLLVASRRFEAIWELDSDSGEVTEVQSEDSEVVLEEFRRKAMDWKEVEDLHSTTLHEVKGNKSNAQNPWQISSVADVLSRVVRLNNKLFFIDTEGQMICKYDLETKSLDTLHLSNLGLLGLPCWWSLPSPGCQTTSCVSAGYDSAQSTDTEPSKIDNVIRIQPGRCLLCINPLLPKGMTWAAPLEEGSIWRQAQGSIVELSMFGGSLMSHQISSAQQWIDDLDNMDDPDFDVRENQELALPPRSESGIPLYTLVDASLGEGEVTIDAVIYLKYAAAEGLPEESQDPISRTHMKGVVKEGDVGLDDQIFLKHLHVKVSLEIDISAPEERTKHLTIHL